MGTVNGVCVCVIYIGCVCVCVCGWVVKKKSSGFYTKIGRSTEKFNWGTNSAF